MNTFRSGDLSIAYERAGAGPPLFLLHGAVSDSRFWRPQVSGLASNFTVVAWDEPGAGRSSDLPEGFGLADYADTLADLIEEVGLGAGCVAGLSWGGTVALELYRRHPALVTSMIFAGSYAGWKGSLPAEEVRARVDGVRKALAGEAAQETAFPGLFGPSPPDDARRLVDEMAADVRPRTVAQQVEVMAAADLSDVLPEVAVPTLLVWGEHDVRSPVGVARQFETALSGAQLEVIPGAGHLSNLEKPELFNRILREFCLASA